jgi:drug/metabolite transporter (DMT)-like permease
MILVNTLLGYILYNQAIMHLKAIQVNMILNLSPFFTAMIAFFALHETLSPLQSAAMLIVFIGTLLVQIAPDQLTK